MENKQPKIFFATNVKYLRERKKISQEVAAEILHITRAKLAALEAGNTKAPQPEDYVNFSDFFKVSVDSLLKVDLTKLGELKLRELESGNDIYIKGGNLRVLAISVDKRNMEHVEYVHIKAKAGYSSGGYGDPEYIAGLPKFSVPNLPKHGTYRIFPITGDSMLPIPDGCDITGQYVEDWMGIKAKTPCIVILKGSQDFVFKMVTLQDNGLVLLESLNPSFRPYELPLGEVVEVWKFYSYTTTALPDAVTDLTRVLFEIKELKAAMGNR